MLRTARDISFYFEIKHNKVSVVSVSNKKNHERIKLLCDGQISKCSKVNFLHSLSEDLQVSRCAPQRSNKHRISSTNQLKILFGAMRIQTFTRSNRIVCESPQLSHKAAGQPVY